MDAPIAPRKPVERTIHGDTFVDDYGWIRDREDPDTIPHLEAENAFTEHEAAHLEEIRERIFAEIKERTQETDQSAPAKRGRYWYVSRTEEGSQYPIYVRMDGAPDGPEEILLDVNAVAEGHDYVRIGIFDVSPDASTLAYSVDVDGSEDYTIRFRDLTTGEDLDDELVGTYYSSAWSADSLHFFYTTIDEMHRPDKVWRHRLGTAQDADVMTLHEDDDRMFVSVGPTQDLAYIVAHAGSQTTADVRFLPADDVEAGWQWVMPRTHGVEYQADHKDGRWLVATNDGAIDGRLLSVVPATGDSEELIGHQEGRKVERVMALRDHVVVTGRSDGLPAVTIISDGDRRDLEFDEPAYSVAPGRNLEYDTRTLRIQYQSMTTPQRVIDIDLTTDERTVVKEQPVLGAFDRDDYVTRRAWAVADDGARIPISIVHRADLDTDEPRPTLLYGYGSYEATYDPWFSIPRLSLLDRGMVFAIAHIRGGGAMGKRWYEAGKMEHKATTFSDFIAAAKHLVESGLTTPDRLVARGGSAGGLLMGAVANAAPDLFAGIVAEVPFVDVVNTMLDESLPLTVIEWEEWGNPAIAEQYAWIRAYSPYENVDATEYPAMLVTGGLNDPRVGFWEPAKWVARMREVATHRGPLWLRMEMGSGHGGPSGRYDAWRDEAFTLAFVLDTLGLADPVPA